MAGLERGEFRESVGRTLGSTLGSDSAPFGNPGVQRVVRAAEDQAREHSFSILKPAGRGVTAEELDRVPQHRIVAALHRDGITLETCGLHAPS